MSDATKKTVIEELQKISDANIGNGISFHFDELKDNGNNGWVTMAQYTRHKLAELKAKLGEKK